MSGTPMAARPESSGREVCIVKKLSHLQMSVVARVLNRFAARCTGTDADFFVLHALERWISCSRKSATPLRLVPNLRAFG